jgi:hypothetical protein
MLTGEPEREHSADARAEAEESSGVGLLIEGEALRGGGDVELVQPLATEGGAGHLADRQPDGAVQGSRW